MRTNGIYYVPRTKVELIKMIRPTWKGKIMDLKGMDVRQLTAIFHRMRTEAYNNFIKKQSAGTAENQQNNKEVL